MTIVLNFPNPVPGDRMWEVEQVFGRPPAPAGHSPAGPAARATHYIL
jgi:hypothetical protein